MKHGESVQIKNSKKGYNIVVSYSDSRAKKDEYNRRRGIEKLQKQIITGKLGKKNINNRGYNKFLEMKGEVEIKINDEKIEADKKWDGLKGYISNCKLNKDEIMILAR